MPHRRLILDAFIAAVLLTILSLTSFFIQVLVDSVFVLGRKSALNWLGLGMLLVTLARAWLLWSEILSPGPPQRED
jgi:ABC-type bacteriocin/lantibiotic exporter with double-glycine peptidase domain